MTALSLPRASEHAEGLLHRLARYVQTILEVYTEAKEMQRQLTRRFPD